MKSKKGKNKECWAMSMWEKIGVTKIADVAHAVWLNKERSRIFFLDPFYPPDFGGLVYTNMAAYPTILYNCFVFGRRDYGQKLDSRILTSKLRQEVEKLYELQNSYPDYDIGVVLLMEEDGFVIAFSDLQDNFALSFVAEKREDGQMHISNEDSPIYQRFKLWRQMIGK